jgi:hypothetical protein
MVLELLGLSLAGADCSAGYLSHMIFMLTECIAALYWSQLGLWCSRMSSGQWLAALTSLVLSVGTHPSSLEPYLKTVLYPPLIGLLMLGTPEAQARVRAFFQNG